VSASRRYHTAPDSLAATRRNNNGTGRGPVLDVGGLLRTRVEPCVQKFAGARCSSIDDTSTSASSIEPAVQREAGLLESGPIPCRNPGAFRPGTHGGYLHSISWSINWPRLLVPSFL